MTVAASFTDEFTGGDHRYGLPSRCYCGAAGEDGGPFGL